MWNNTYWKTFLHLSFPLLNLHSFFFKKIMINTIISFTLKPILMWLLFPLKPLLLISLITFILYLYRFIFVSFVLNILVTFLSYLHLSQGYLTFSRVFDYCLHVSNLEVCVSISTPSLDFQTQISSCLPGIYIWVSLHRLRKFIHSKTEPLIYLYPGLDLSSLSQKMVSLPAQFWNLQMWELHFLFLFLYLSYSSVISTSKTPLISNHSSLLTLPSV